MLRIATVVMIAVYGPLIRPIPPDVYNELRRRLRAIVQLD